MTRTPSFWSLSSFLRRRPQAFALLNGSSSYPDLRGRAEFRQTPYGVLVTTQFLGLPTAEARCESPIFALHIHGGDRCEGNESDPFADAGMHYNPYDCPHPYHAGDLPPVFGADGRAFSAVLTDRFTVREILGKTVILHASLDDFTTQPSGNAGKKIACGVIRTAR